MHVDMSDAIHRRPLHVEVADRLRELILEGEIAAGERLNERLLAERFGISRTPLREAIKILSLEGLVKLLPNRGAEVTRLTPGDIEDMFQVMGALEGLAGEIACKRASDRDIEEIRDLHEAMRERYEVGDRAGYFKLNQQIHARIVASAGNRELGTTYVLLARRIDRARYMANFSTSRWSRAMQEHEEILDALSRRESERLKAILRSHLEAKLEAVRAWIGEHGGVGEADGERRGAAAHG